MESNSCRICLSKTQSLEQLNLFLDENSTVSDFGQLYEEVFEIPLDDRKIRLKYICNSCGLQLKLFKQLKNKALETHLFLIQLSKAVLFDDDIVENEEGTQFETNLSPIESHMVNSNEIGPEYLVQNEETKVLVDFDESQHNEQVNTISQNDILENSMIENVVTENDNVEKNITENYLDEIPDINKDHEVYDELSEQSDKQQEDLATDCVGEVIKNDEDLGLNDTDEEEYEVCYLEEEFVLENTEKEVDKNEYEEQCLVEDENIDDETVSCSKTVYVQKSFNCSHCSAAFQTQSQLKHHKNKMHPKTTKIQCQLCNKILYSQETYQAHMNVHNGLPAYQCNICEKTFNQKVHYNYHMLNHKNERNNICNICQKRFLSNGDLKIHLRCHSDERRYKCDICDKRFRAHTHMVNHRYSHFEKQFECPMCFQKYMSPNTLRTHFKDVHSAEVPFECEFCEKRFKRKHHLQAHYRTHSNMMDNISTVDHT